MFINAAFSFRSQIGKVIVIPLAMHSAVALVVSIFVFPSSVSTQFTARLQASIAPLITGLELHQITLRTPTDSPKFSPKAIFAAVDQAEGSLIDLAAAARLLKSDIIYSRFAPSDFSELHKLMRQLVVRSNGMTVYFKMLDTTRERFPVTPAPSKPQTPAVTPTTSGPPSLDCDHAKERPTSETPLSAIEDHNETSATHRRGHSRRYKKNHVRSHSQHQHSNRMYHSLLHLAVSRNPKPEHAVGVFESNRYLNLESLHMTDPDSVRTTARITKLLDESADELIAGCIDALKGVHTWLAQVREGRWDFWVSREENKSRLNNKLKKSEEIKRTLEDILERFRYDKRYDNQGFKSTNHIDGRIHTPQVQCAGAIPSCIWLTACRVDIG